MSQYSPSGISKCEESNVASRETKGCPGGIPIGDRLADSFVCKLCHVHDAAPPVLTSPSVPAGIWEGGRGAAWWTLVGVLEVVGGHDSFETIVVSKHKGYSHLILPVVVESRIALDLI